jgi:hypothetical protein
VSRQIETGTLIVDTFPAFEEDGYTRKSGLLPTDFMVTQYLDGATTAIPLVISEVGVTGQYSFSFTPTVDGYYQVIVEIPYNHDVWEGEYEVGDFLTHIVQQIDKIDLAPTLGPAAVVSGCLMDRLMHKNANKTYNQGTDSLEAIRDRVG